MKMTLRELKSVCTLSGVSTSLSFHLLLLGLFCLIPALSRAQVSNPATCTSATASCTEWVTLGAGPDRSSIYRTYPLDIPNSAIHRALVMVHGSLRNADHYFSTALAAAFLAGALADTEVVAPRFTSADRQCKDSLAPNEVSWSCDGDSWRSGGISASNPNLTSFEFIDAILRTLADKRIFPNLTKVVVAGHSAGGMFVNRYEMSNRVDGTLDIAVSYVVANPSSYAWPDATRALPVGDGAPANAIAAWKDEAPHTNFTFGPFDTTKAPSYDRWLFGLEDRTGGYTATMSDAQLLKQLVSRPTTYLLSQVDTLPLGGFDESPSAMAQGATRRARGEAYVKYVNEHLGAKHKLMIVPECGHNDRCVFTTNAVLPILFPNP